MSQQSFRILGKNTIRKDGLAKVTGQEKFSSDLSLPGMLHIRLLRSIYPHAIVKKIDFSEATKLGAIVITPDDLPDIKFCPRLVSTPEATYKDWCILSKKALYVGDPIAAIAAESEELAQLALESIKVDYEILPSYFEAEKANTSESVLLHDSIELNNVIIKPNRNIACSLDISEGDVEAGFKESEIIIERKFVTNRRYHAQLETKSVLVR
ncbi:xanthine dehydrogenase family protein molybdopterin-binding subunit, partial [Candidatus Bathyarchaeota archaeon]|nr:xanthine dehydrogenase family protein molybdopterin-binding subunit [Candidatus Bathyarchaeota archaeon]